MPISHVQRLRDAGVDIPKLARDGVTIFFTQVFRDGFFHADMHPGNIQVSIAPATFGRYISLDFGIIGTLTQFDKDYLAQNFIAFFHRDYKRVAELHVESGWVPPQTRIDELEGAIRAVCEPQFDRPLKDISLGQVLLRLFQTSRRFNVEIQPQLVLLQKTLLNVEGLGRDLDPELDLWSTAKPFLERWMEEQVGMRGLMLQLEKEAPRYVHLLPQLPRLIHAALQPPPPSQQRALEALLAEQRRTNRLLVAVLVARDRLRRRAGALMQLADALALRSCGGKPAKIYTVGLPFPDPQGPQMPIYAYRCSSCGHAQDVLQRMSDPVLSVCPACGQPTYVKQVTAAGFQLKGSGWYVTDFRGDKKAAPRPTPTRPAPRTATRPPQAPRRRPARPRRAATPARRTAMPAKKPDAAAEPGRAPRRQRRARARAAPPAASPPTDRRSRA